MTRGLPTDRTLLFVVDGAAGLRRAITDVFGSRGVVHRREGRRWVEDVVRFPQSEVRQEGQQRGIGLELLRSLTKRLEFPQSLAPAPSGRILRA